MLPAPACPAEAQGAEGEDYRDGVSLSREADDPRLGTTNSQHDEAGYKPRSPYWLPPAEHFSVLYLSAQCILP
jgi:hypothetical protein